MTLILLPGSGLAWYPTQADHSFLPPGNPAPVVGSNQVYTIRPNDSLVDLAYRVGVGYESMVNANPGVDPWMPSKGLKVLIPYQTILPPNPVPGIVINIAEFRLYYTWRESGRLRVRIYPLGIGREGWDTPVGRFAIASKIRNPTWMVPESIRNERPGQPTMVPPGPENPLGGYWLGLSIKGYGIHGTHRPLGVGRRVSHGCMRLYPQDIDDLFSRVEVKTPVNIVFQPVKVGLRENKLWAEIHPDTRDQPVNMVNEIIRMRTMLEWEGKIDWPKVWREMDRKSGIPFVISSP
ncbi:MAG: L,D-transpeptidase family protein [Desulfuromonadaceae bacterium]|nr:L,D-transpeptidase family protein [Desulfuromonadaceae bacterium]